jgi:hypothetical protein
MVMGSVPAGQFVAALAFGTYLAKISSSRKYRRKAQRVEHYHQTVPRVHRVHGNKSQKAGDAWSDVRIGAVGSEPPRLELEPVAHIVSSPERKVYVPQRAEVKPMIGRAERANVLSSGGSTRS